MSCCQGSRGFSVWLVGAGSCCRQLLVRHRSCEPTNAPTNGCVQYFTKDACSIVQDLSYVRHLFQVLGIGTAGKDCVRPADRACHAARAGVGSGWGLWAQELVAGNCWWDMWPHESTDGWLCAILYRVSYMSALVQGWGSAMQAR